MKKAILQALLMTAIFFLSWFALSKIDWMTLFKVKKATESTEEKLGELFWDLFRNTEKEVSDSLVLQSIDSIVTRICDTNRIDRKSIKLHILQKDEVNAFALPGRHLILFSGLIRKSDNPEELSGVIGHELGHIELNHVMQKLVREVGLSVLISMTTGGKGGTEVITETAKFLSTTAFDRELEKEADLRSVDYLFEAKINPENFANFLYRMSALEPDAARYLGWISTHPESKERAKYIIEYIGNSIEGEISFNPALSQSNWEAVKERLERLF